MARRKLAEVPKLTAHDCVTALRTRFEPRAYALLEQVANGTGWKANRWADAVAFSLWPSRGLMLHGFEIKVSRQDWKKELAQPEKSADIQAYCDHWWIVAPKGLVETTELPPTWGLLEVDDKGKCNVRVQAPTLEAKTLDRPMLAAIFRRVAESTDALLRRERKAGIEEGAKCSWSECTRGMKKLTRMR